MNKKVKLFMRYWIEESEKIGRFLDSGSVIEGRSCLVCKRRFYSFPYTCKDGGPWSYSCPKKGEKCANFKSQVNYKSQGDLI